MAGCDLVLLGAGHAQLEVLRRFARRPEPGVRLTLLTRAPAATYSGLVPAVIRGEAAPAAALVPLAPLAAAAGARLVVGEAVAIDLGTRRVTLRVGDSVGFDLLSLDVGGVAVVPPGDAAVIAVKPIDLLFDRLAALEAALPAGARLAVVGDGAGGVELALALARRFAGRAQILLVGAGAEPLAEAPARARRAVRAALLANGVAVRSGVRAGPLADGQLALSDGTSEPVAAALWATGVVGPRFLAASGLGCDTAGCVQVAPSLQSLTHPAVFAAGDCAAIAGAPRPKAGVWAVRAGPVLAENLRRAARGEALRDWQPQRLALAILGLGDGRAVAWRGGHAWVGRGAAWWKSRLDPRWLARYR